MNFDRHNADIGVEVKDEGVHAIGDEPIRSVKEDKLSLDRKIGALIPLLFKKATMTPLTIALYGHWGMGKSSAMKWLEN